MERTLSNAERHAVERDGIYGSDPETLAACQRLERLTLLNSEFESRAAESASHHPRRAVHGTGYETAYAVLGACLGMIPPGAFFLRVFLDESTADIFPLMLIGSLVIVTASLTGFFSGKIVGRIVRELTGFRWSVMLAALPFIGITWGLIAGGAGGAIIFLIGAIPGAVMGAAVGSVALTAFAAIHRLVKTGDEIDRNHLVPMAIGISTAIAAAFLGATA